MFFGVHSPPRSSLLTLPASSSSSLLEIKVDLVNRCGPKGIMRFLKLVRKKCAYSIYKRTLFLTIRHLQAALLWGGHPLR